MNLNAAGVPDKFAALGLTFDDVLLLPGETDVIPSEVHTSSRLTREITVRLLAGLSAMDTVTESRMAIAMARQGGLGVLHRNLSIEDQAGQADFVKRSESGMISDPVTIGPDATSSSLDEFVRPVPDLRPAGRRRRQRARRHHHQPRPAVRPARRVAHPRRARGDDPDAAGHRTGRDQLRRRRGAAAQAQAGEVPRRRRRAAHRADHGQGLREVEQYRRYQGRRRSLAVARPSATSGTPGSGPPRWSRPGSTSSSPTWPTATPGRCST